MRRWLAVIALGLGAAAAGFATPAFAQQGYAPTTGGLTVSKSSPAPGETITVSGKCQAPGIALDIAITPPGTVIGHAVTGSDGSFSTNVTIPANQPLGVATIIAVDAARTCVLTAQVNVTKAGSLAFTGSSNSTGTIVGVAIVLVVLGALLLVVAKRRARRSEARERVRA